MVANPDVWAVSVTDAEHDPALARVGNFLASGPKRGIIPAGPSSSGAVVPMSTPSNKGLVLPCVAVAPNDAPGHFGETYAWRLRTAQEFTLRAASSGGARTDAIISRVWDPGVFGGSMSGDNFATVEVIEGVDNGVESAAQLAASHALDFPFVWHGNVTLPASENVVSADRITDKRYQIGGEVSHDERVHTDIGATWITTRDREGQIFPSIGGQHALFIPEWAGQMKVRFEWHDIHYSGTSNAYGDRFVRVGSGSDAIETTRYYFDTPNRGSRQTIPWSVVDVLAVPEAMRGTTQRFEARAYLGSGSADQQVRTVGAAATILDVEFRETLN